MQTSHSLLPAAPAECVADADITAAIETLLSTKKGMSYHQIIVQTHEGVVTLSGFTDNLLSQQRAEEIALAVRGVRSLLSTLGVRTTGVADAELRHAVAQALADDPATASYQVHCVVTEGVVTLTGMVQSWAEKQLVLRVIKGVRGVRDFRTDDLGIRGGAILNSDQAITTQIRELLDWDIRINGTLVEVRTQDQVVHLTGTVGTAAEKDRIVAIAYQTGATRVDARDLFVAYWALGREIRRQKFAPKSDEGIAQAVRDTLCMNPRVQSTEILVQVLQGVVTLAGTVSNLRTRQDAEQDARHVVGVADVYNLLQVRPEPLVPDKGLGQTIAAALAWNPYLGHYEFRVQVHGGKVLLTGQVDSHFEQEQAGEVAAGISGVIDVNNQVEVSGLSSPAPFADPLLPQRKTVAMALKSDQALAERIRCRYCWSAALHDQEIEVLVENGRATLTGTVDTWLDRKQAAHDASEAGAREVNNHLLVLSTLSLSCEPLANAPADEHPA